MRLRHRSVSDNDLSIKSEWNKLFLVMTTFYCFYEMIISIMDMLYTHLQCHELYVWGIFRHSRNIHSLFIHHIDIILYFNVRNRYFFWKYICMVTWIMIIRITYVSELRNFDMFNWIPKKARVQNWNIFESTKGTFQNACLYFVFLHFVYYDDVDCTLNCAND